MEEFELLDKPRDDIFEAICIWLTVSISMLLAVPNPNIPFVDDLALLQGLFVWPAFFVLSYLIYRQVKSRPPRQLTLLLCCAVAASFHTSALLFHFTGEQNEKLINRSPGTLEYYDGSTSQMSPDSTEVNRIRNLPHGSGSYVMETLYTGSKEKPLNEFHCSYSGNSPNGPLPNWLMPLRVIPWSFRPQYWVAVNQRSPRKSLLLLADKEGQLKSQNTLFLVLAVILAVLPWYLNREDEKTTRGRIFLGLWLLIYQPWLAFFW